MVQIPQRRLEMHELFRLRHRRDDAHVFATRRRLLTERCQHRLAILSAVSSDTEQAMQADHIRSTVGVDPATLREVEQVYRAWDAALKVKDVEAAVALYADSVRLESPLVRHLTNSEDGVIDGRERLRDFIHLVFAHTPANRGHFRTGFFTDGHRLIWEYPRETPNGDQMDFVESMEIENGLIRRHRIYWGWLGVKIIEENRYYR